MTPREFIVSIFDGIIGAVGIINPKLEWRPGPDRLSKVALVRDGYHVQKFAGPQHFSREHVFHDLDSFAKWLDLHANPDLTDIMVDLPNQEVVASLHPRIPGTDEVSCELGPSATQESVMETLNIYLRVDFLVCFGTHSRHIVPKPMDAKNSPW